MKGYTNPHIVCTPRELSDILSGSDASNAPAVTLLDGRPAEEFAAGHIGGAAHLDLMGLSLIDTSPGPMRAFLWMIEHLLASRGVQQDRPVVVYDDQSGLRAARAFWFLDYFGHPDVRILDGGFGAWTRAGLPVSTTAETPKASRWTGARDDEKLASWIDVEHRLGRPDALLLDARSDQEYFGEQVRAARGGAIPGAVHVEWTRNLDETGAFKPAPELRRMYEDAGITPEREVVTYCQGAYRAAHAYVALRLLGYPRVRNYLGSWKEWGDRVDLPIDQPKRPEQS
jgi:thiosulfate/3-mercaptopyruvate sulfurtransferase